MFRAALLTIILLAAASPLAAQPWAAPADGFHPAPNPNMSLAPRGNTPIEQQMQQNYRTDLLQQQRDMLQQDPSGTGREQLNIGNQLNQYNSAPR